VRRTLPRPPRLGAGRAPEAFRRVFAYAGRPHRGLGHSGGWVCELARLRPTLALEPLYGRALDELAQRPVQEEQPVDAGARAPRSRRPAEAGESPQTRVAPSGRGTVRPRRTRVVRARFSRRRRPGVPAHEQAARDGGRTLSPARTGRHAAAPLEGRFSPSQPLRLAPQATLELLRELTAQDAWVASERGEAAGALALTSARRDSPGSTPTEGGSARSPGSTHTGGGSARRRPVDTEASDVQRWRAAVVRGLVRRLIGRDPRASTQPVMAVWWSEALAGERAPRALLDQLVENGDARPAQPPALQQPARRPEPVAKPTRATGAAAPPPARPADEDPAPPGDPTTAALQRDEPRAPLWPPTSRAPGSPAFELAAEEAAEEELAALSDRLARILREEARRHGVDL
jgi:hypothetical protein